MTEQEDFIIKEYNRKRKVIETANELIIDLPHFKNVIIPINTPVLRLWLNRRKIFRIICKESLVTINKKLIDKTKQNTTITNYYLFISDLYDYIPKFKQGDLKPVIRWARYAEQTK